MKVQAQRLTATGVLVLAAAAFLTSSAPAANAVVTPPDTIDRYVNNALQTETVPDAIERYLDNARRTDAVRPDDRADVRGAVLASDLTPSPSLASGERFQWNDAAIGAGVMLGFALALITLAGIRQHRKVALR